MHDGAPFFLRLGALTLANKRRYAERHGYEMVAHVPEGTDGLFLPADCLTPGTVRRLDGACYTPFTDFANDDRAATFGKIKLVLAACVSRPDWWLLWSDADALIVNQSVPLTTLIDDAYHMSATEDWLMMNAGVLLFRCSPFTIDFLTRVYADVSFNSARALDQSALQHYLDSEPEAAAAMRWLPKHAMNVYTEEYRPGDFLVHMAGKLYEATTSGATAIARQFDLLSRAGDDVADVAAFFDTRYLAGGLSGLCPDEGNGSQCPPEDERRMKLAEPLGAMANPGRYKHVGLRYDWLEGWTDRHDPSEPMKVPFVPIVIGNVVHAVAPEPPTDLQPVDGRPVVNAEVPQDDDLDGLPVVILDASGNVERRVEVQSGGGHDTSEL
ncbi:hypothetical protein MMPV_006644 [Pyropia vietnamensis]